MGTLDTQPLPPDERKPTAPARPEYAVIMVPRERRPGTDELVPHWAVWRCETRPGGLGRMEQYGVEIVSPLYRTLRAARKALARVVAP
jgi:hypothetical protein